MSALKPFLCNYISIVFFNIHFFGLPHLATCIFFFFYNEPELGVGINPGMALNQFHLALDWTGIKPTTFRS